MSKIDEAYEGFYPLLEEVLKGDKEAIAFIKTLFLALHLWDDLVDQDKPLEAAGIRQVFWGLLVALPANGFYVRNFTTLQPSIISAILNWESSNILEQHQQKGDLEIAFILRSAFIDIVLMCAFIVGGADWARDSNITLRRLEHSEGFQHYKQTANGGKK